MRSGFFNSTITGYDANNMPIFDRAESADFFAKYFSEFIGNGVYPNPSTNLQVVAVSGMNIKATAGTCFINGYLGWAESDEELTIEESESLARIDRVVAGLDLSTRTISIYVKKGTASGTPTAPTLTRSGDVYEIGLADVNVPANAIQITDSNITDLRLNSDYCGIVAGVITQIDTTTIFNQYNSWFTETKTQAESDIADIINDFEDYVDEFESDMTSWKTTQQTDFENWEGNQKTAFEAWVASIQDILDEQTAGHLLNLIEQRELLSNKVTSINSSSTDTQYPSAKCVYDAIEEVREEATKAIDFKGQVQTYADLPNNPTEGDLYQVLTADPTHQINAGDFVVWEITNNVGTWLNLGSFVDLDQIYNLLDIKNTFTIATTDWSADTTYGDYTVKATITITGVTANDLCDIYYNEASQSIALDSNATGVKTVSGGVEIYAESIPSGAISGTYKVAKVGGSV